jgi:hypothetical protein
MSVDRKYQRLAKFVRYLNELNAVRDRKPAEYISPRFFGVR